MSLFTRLAAGITLTGLLYLHLAAPEKTVLSSVIQDRHTVAGAKQHFNLEKVVHSSLPSRRARSNGRREMPPDFTFLDLVNTLIWNQANNESEGLPDTYVSESLYDDILGELAPVEGLSVQREQEYNRTTKVTFLLDEGYNGFPQTKGRMYGEVLVSLHDGTYTVSLEVRAPHLLLLYNGIPSLEAYEVRSLLEGLRSTVRNFTDEVTLMLLTGQEPDSELVYDLSNLYQLCLDEEIEDRTMERQAP